MKRFLKILFSRQVITAVISAIGAIVSVAVAGCRLSLGEMSVKDMSAEINIPQEGNNK